MKDFFKSIFANKVVQNIIAWLSYLYINLVFKTSKIIVKGNLDGVVKYLESGKGMVMFTWHGRSLISPIGLRELLKGISQKDRKVVVLSSIHRDGRIAAGVMSRFNIGVIDGSTINPKKGSLKNKKSLSSLRNTMKALNDGTICVLGPDGPRGPVFKMNTKIVEIVKKTNTAIACAAVSFKRKKQLKTWDRFQLAYPFNTIIIEYSRVVKPKKSDSLEEINCQLENELNEMTRVNDKEVLK